jgi:hypothetical protein
MLQKYGLNLRKFGTGTTDSFQLKRAAAADTTLTDEVSTKQFLKDLKEI